MDRLQTFASAPITSHGAKHLFTTEVNWEAPVKNSKSIFIQSTPSRVWQVLTNINLWPSWMSDVKTAHLKGALAPQTTFDWKEQGLKVHSTLHTVDLEQRFGWTGKVYGIYAVHNFTLSAVDGGTEVLVEESLEGFLARVFKKAFNKTLEQSMIKSLEELKSTCERNI